MKSKRLYHALCTYCVQKNPDVPYREQENAIFLPPEDEDERVVTDSLKGRLGQLDERPREQFIAVMLCPGILG